MEKIYQVATPEGARFLMRFSFLTSKPPVFFPRFFSIQDCFFDKKQRTSPASVWGLDCAQTPKVGVGLDFVWNLARWLVVSQIPESPLHFALGHHRKNKTSNKIGVEVATAGPRILISGVKSRALEVRFGHFPMKGGEGNSDAWFFSVTPFLLFFRIFLLWGRVRPPDVSPTSARCPTCKHHGVPEDAHTVLCSMGRSKCLTLVVAFTLLHKGGCLGFMG